MNEKVDLNLVMKHVLRISEGYNMLYEELKELKREVSELKGGEDFLEKKRYRMKIVRNNMGNV